MKANAQAGFTLIELMVVVSIIMILAAIAVPLYTNYVYRGKQVEAKTLLMTIKVEQEQFRAENNCYTTNIANLTQSDTLFTNNNVYNKALGTTTILGVNASPCGGVGLSNDFQVYVTGKVASGHPTDVWAISDLIPAPVHCDGRAGRTANQTAACSAQTTTEMEF